MKKTIMSLVALSMITTVAMAENQTYFGAGLVIEEIEDMDNGIALELSAGMALDNNWGIEAKISKTVKSAEVKEKNFPTMEADITTISLFGTYTVQASPEFRIVPKIGFTNYNMELGFDTNSIEISIDDSSINISYGIDFKYNLSSKTTLYAGYTIFNPEFEFKSEKTDFDASHISFGVQQAF